MEKMFDPREGKKIGINDNCESCQTQTHPFKCFICEHPGSMEWHRDNAAIEEIERMLIGIKLCTKHARELDELHARKEIERTVA